MGMTEIQWIWIVIAIIGIIAVAAFMRAGDR